MKAWFSERPRWVLGLGALCCGQGVGGGGCREGGGVLEGPRGSLQVRADSREALRPT